MDDEEFLNAIFFEVVSPTGFAISLFIANTQVLLKDGNKQGRWRQISAALFFTFLQMVPIFLLIGLWHSLYEENWSGIPAILTGLFIALYHALTLYWKLEPSQRGEQKTKFPLVKDAEFLGRVDQLARSMGVVPTPRCRQVGSLNENLATQAGVAGLLEPTLYVCDGIIERLSPDEQDAIVAHELGHLTNGSLRVCVGIGLIAACLGILVAAVVPGFFAIAWWLAFWVGSYRIVWRYIEIDCDRRAAQAVGVENITQALRKIHAALGLKVCTLWDALQYSVSTHPRLETRLQELLVGSKDAAIVDFPEDDRRIARNQSRLAWLAACLWFMAMTGSLVFHSSGSPAIIVLGIVFILPFVKQVVEGFQQARLANRRRRVPGDKNYWSPRIIVRIDVLVVFCAVIALLKFDSAFFHKHGMSHLLPMAFPAMILLLVLSFLKTKSEKNVNKLNESVIQAIQDRKFKKAIRLIRDATPEERRNPFIRFNLGLATALNGNVVKAIERLERLRKAAPDFLNAHLSLITFYLELNDLTHARSLINECIAKLPKDPNTWALLVRVACREGNPDEASAAAEKLKTFAGTEAYVATLRAEIAMTQGDLEQAYARIQDALRMSPGDTNALIFKALIIIRAQSPAVAVPLVQEALASFNANPYCRLTWEVGQLQQWLVLQDSNLTQSLKS